MSEPNIPESWPSIQPKGLPDSFDYRADSFDASDVDGLDDDGGDALVISEPGAEGAYVASTVDALSYIGSRS